MNGRVPSEPGSRAVGPQPPAASSPAGADPSRDRRGRFLRKLRITPDNTREWLIWSREWRAWHRRSAQGGACGYTDDIAMAGLFPRTVAASYHDGIKDEAYHISEKRELLLAEIRKHDEAVGRLTAIRDSDGSGEAGPEGQQRGPKASPND